MKNISAVIAIIAASLGANAYAQGHVAHAQSSAKIVGSVAEGYPQLGPWPITVGDGNVINSGSFNLSALASNPGGSLNGKSTTASAYADLRSGKLGALASVSNQVSTSSTTASVFAMGVASFGDSYRFASALTGLPYDWSTEPRVVFNFHLDGDIANSSEDGGAVHVQINFELFKPGTIGTQYSGSDILASVVWGSTTREDGSLVLDNWQDSLDAV